MRLTSLVPFRDGGALTRPDFGLFGLHREIDRLFSEFAQGVGPSTKIIPNIDISENDKALEISAEMPVDADLRHVRIVLRAKFIPTPVAKIGEAHVQTPDADKRQRGATDLREVHRLAAKRC